MIVFDIETNGLLDELDRIHLLTVCRGVGMIDVYRRNETEDTIAEGLRNLMESVEWAGEVIAGHNVIAFDIPAIKKVYPWFAVPESSVFDTLVFSRLKFPDLFPFDVKAKLKGTLPGKLAGRHSLEAWGYRLGAMKGEYEGDPLLMFRLMGAGMSPAAAEKEMKRRKWEAWNPAMEEYGVQDAVVTRKLLDHLNPERYSPEALALEHRVQWIVQRQVRHGFHFFEDKAIDLYGTLTARRSELARTLKDTVPGAYWQDGKVFTPKRDSKAHGYVEGAPLSKIKWEAFNPTSRCHIVRFLTKTYGWQPMKFTDGGDPAMDDEVLSALDYPEAKLLAEYFMVEKRIGQLAEGDEAWMKRVRNDRIHGDVNTNGAVTGRMTHSRPNLAQVPKVGTPYGAECRALFGPRPGYVQVGADASGLELRCLGHYMARWDDGAYARAVVEGSSEDESDVHSLNTKAIGLEPKKVYTLSGTTSKGRDFGKRFIYAFIYGAGDAKIGQIVGKSRGYGTKLRAMFLKKTPALKKLIDAVQSKAKTTKTLRGLDGRTLHIRSSHSALNTLLQSAGALVMKQALVFLDDSLQAAGHKPGVDYEFVANVHDEWQIECRKEIADEVGRTAVASIRRAGDHFEFRCPLDGEAKQGASWADTH
jgi:hypothetical protein